MYDYRGVIHVHSTYSDGHGDFAEIARAANDVGLDFVIMTDHDTMRPHDEGMEKWHGSTLFITGTEITPAQNHYLAFGEGRLEGAERLREGSPQETIDGVHKQGWLGFIAHPDHQGTKRFEVPSHAWTDWSVDRFTGMSIWDLMTDFQSKLDRENVGFELYDNFPQHLTGPRPETTRRWDELNLKRLVVGIGEIDNHKKPYRVKDRELAVFPYEVAFRTITNHVLLEKPLERDYAAAKRQILEAIRAGRLYVSFDWWHDPTEFTFEIEEISRVARMGETLALDEIARIVIALPDVAHLSVIRDGQMAYEEETIEAILECEDPGLYRVEALKDGLPWILSNPIRVAAAS